MDRNALHNVLLFASLTGMEKFLTQESRQLVFLSLIFPLQYAMPGEHHLLHKSVSPGYMVLRRYKISWVSASAGVNWHNPCEVRGSTANYICKGSGSAVPEIKSKKSSKILHSHTQVRTGIAQQLLQVSLKQH